MKKILVLLLFLSVSCFAQNDFDFDFDYARFKYDSSNVFMEIYYSFNQGDLKITQKDGSSFIEGILDIKIVDRNDNNTVLSKQWDIPNEVQNADSSFMNQRMVGVIGLYLKEGNYKLVVTGSDKNNLENNRKIEEDVTITPFDKSELSLSDIELASNIIKDGADKNSIFYKNSLEIIPNPQMLYSNTKPVLFYYSELYNIKNNDQNPLQLHKVLYNSKGFKVYDKISKLSRKYDSRVEMGFINLVKYPTDSYTLVLAAVDSIKNESYATKKRFFLFNPDVKDTIKAPKTQWNYYASHFTAFSHEECDDYFDKSKYVANEWEIDKYDELDSLNAKREFLYNFWKNRDLSPDTPVNEFQKEYFERIKFAQRKYSAFSIKGYKTDQGRTYILYGEPDQIDRYPNQMDMKPYEIWRYNSLEGGVYFIFGDVTGFGNYELLHSTKRGELYDDNWTRRIQEQ